MDDLWIAGDEALREGDVESAATAYALAVEATTTAMCVCGPAAPAATTTNNNHTNSSYSSGDESSSPSTTSAFEDDPEQVAARRFVSYRDQLLLEGNKDAAVRVFSRAVCAWPGGARALLQHYASLGDSLVADGKTHGARRMYVEAAELVELLETTGEAAAAYAGLGDRCLAARDSLRARRMYTAAVNVAPGLTVLERSRRLADFGARLLASGSAAVATLMLTAAAEEVVDTQDQARAFEEAASAVLHAGKADAAAALYIKAADSVPMSAVARSARLDDYSGAIARAGYPDVAAWLSQAPQLDVEASLNSIAAVA